MSTPERPRGSIAEAAARKLAEFMGEPKAEEPEAGPEPQAPPEVFDEPEPVEPPDEPTTPEEEAEEAADEAEADLPDDASADEIAEAREQAKEEFYAGTYKTREEAEKGIAEQTLTIDRLFSEVNHYKQLERERQEAERAEQAEEIDRPAWEEWAADAVEQGAGAQGALDALTEGGYDGYQVYLRHWMDDPEQVTAATLFNNEVMLSMAEARAQAAAATAAAQPTPREQDEQAYQMVKGRRPDFDSYTEQMGEVTDTLHPDDARYLQHLASQGAPGKARALDILYLEARSRGPVSSPAQQAENQRRKVSGDADRLAASSLQSEGAPPRTRISAIEQEGLKRKAEFRERMNLPPLE